MAQRITLHVIDTDCDFELRNLEFSVLLYHRISFINP
jgi:hypothetical protein